MRTAAALVLSVALCGTAGADTVYRNALWRFRIEIADGWHARTLPPESGAMRLLIEGPKPLGKKEVCAVYVERESQTDGTKQAALDRAVREGRYFGPSVLDLDRAGTVVKDAVIGLNGRSARLVERLQAMQNDPPKKIWAYTLRFLAPGRFFRAFCAASDEHSAQYRPVFERMLRSLTVLP